MGIEKLMKAAQAAGQAMATVDDEFESRQPRQADAPKPVDAWRYGGHRSGPAKPTANEQPPTVWSFFTGKATA
ncbi:MAG: hypothetical protein RLZ98_3335 [Pseudomonadota bacterium]|jgi:hypothetical protein